jgi:hypothetical protein
MIEKERISFLFRKLYSMIRLGLIRENLILNRFEFNYRILACIFQYDSVILNILE